MYSNYKKYQSLYTVYYYFRIRAKEVTPCSFFYINLEYNIASVTQNVFQKFKIVYKSNCNAKKYVYKDVFLCNATKYVYKDIYFVPQNRIKSYNC